MKLFLSSVVSAGLLLALPSMAYAQFSSDSSAPTILDADDAFTSNGVITLIGQADIRQGDVRLLADKVQIYTEGGGGGLIATSGFTRMVATGNFYYITPDQEVRGDKGVYTRADDSFVVTGDVVLLQDDSVVTGKKLNYNLETREAKVAGNCEGRKCKKGRRVSILIRSTDTAQGTN
jgi:lipopolysaccharide export system protein LptA